MRHRRLTGVRSSRLTWIEEEPSSASWGEAPDSGDAFSRSTTPVLGGTVEAGVGDGVGAVGALLVGLASGGSSPEHPDARSSVAASVTPRRDNELITGHLPSR